ncbi:MAG: hypothetical protein JRI68_06620 [Deltaproteobacteria bacterium]|nr:hypothetical protein [Deltaproteobacteria bacterium]
MSSQTVGLAVVLMAGVLLAGAFLTGCGHFAVVHTTVPEACGDQNRTLNWCMYHTACMTRERCQQTCPAEVEALLHCEATAPAPGSAAPTSCVRDLDCTGDLICEQGRCAQPQ